MRSVEEAEEAMLRRLHELRDPKMESFFFLAPP
jgi:hypothetical protein